MNRGDHAAYLAGLFLLNAFSLLVTNPIPGWWGQIGLASRAVMTIVFMVLYLRSTAGVND